MRDAGVRAPLILQVVMGMDAKTIASAFLLSPAAMGKRQANVPSPDNLKTSLLACLSPLALLRGLSAQLLVGS